MLLFHADNPQTRAIKYLPELLIRPACHVHVSLNDVRRQGDIQNAYRVTLLSLSS